MNCTVCKDRDKCLALNSKFDIDLKFCNPTMVIKGCDSFWKREFDKITDVVQKETAPEDPMKLF